MGILKGFIILSEKRTDLTDKITYFLNEIKVQKKEYYSVIDNGIYPNEWFKPSSHFSRNGKDKLKIFLEVSCRNRIYTFENKKSDYDYETFFELNKVINEYGANDLFLFPFMINSGLKKTKPTRMLKEWKGKLI
jgi:hypothetical protein